MDDFEIPEEYSKEELIELLISKLNTRDANRSLKGCGMDYINIIICEILTKDSKKIWWDL
jgi:hypothetical protein